MILFQTPDDKKIADAVAAVFRERVYAAPHARSPLELLLQWAALQAGRGLTALASHPGVALVVRLASLLALALIALRLLLGILPAAAALSFARRRPAPRGENPWDAARRLAASGCYTEAAHALYHALLLAAATRGAIVVDQAKTTGDYLREMQRRAEPASVHAFRDFARSYERVIYAGGSCDETQYTRLATLASTARGAPL